MFRNRVQMLFDWQINHIISISLESQMHNFFFPFSYWETIGISIVYPTLYSLFGDIKRNGMSRKKLDMYLCGKTRVLVRYIHEVLFISDLD